MPLRVASGLRSWSSGTLGGIELALIRNELAGEIGRDCLLECVVEDIWVEGFLCDGFEVEGGRVEIVGQHHINSQNIMAEQVSAAKISERAEEGYVFDSVPLLSLRMTTDIQNSSGVLAKLAAFSLALAIIPISAYFGTQTYLAPGAKYVSIYL